MSWDHYLDLAILDHDAPVNDYVPDCTDCGSVSTVKCEECSEPVCDEHTVRCYDCRKCACTLCTFDSIHDGKRRCVTCHRSGGHGTEKAEAA